MFGNLVRYLARVRNGKWSLRTRSWAGRTVLKQKQPIVSGITSDRADGDGQSDVFSRKSAAGQVLIGSTSAGVLRRGEQGNLIATDVMFQSHTAVGYPGCLQLPADGLEDVCRNGATVHRGQAAGLRSLCRSHAGGQRNLLHIGVKHAEADDANQRYQHDRQDHNEFQHNRGSSAGRIVQAGGESCSAWRPWSAECYP